MSRIGFGLAFSAGAAALGGLGCGHTLDETAASRMLEAELRRPASVFCCDRIESPAARAKCATDADGQCGFAVGGRVRATSFGTMGHGDVALGHFEVAGPNGRGSCDAQFVWVDRSWIIERLGCAPASR